MHLWFENDPQKAGHQGRRIKNTTGTRKPPRRPPDGLSPSLLPDCMTAHKPAGSRKSQIVLSSFLSCG